MDFLSVPRGSTLPAGLMGVGGGGGPGPQDRTESLSEVNPLIYGQLINKGGASTRRWKESLQQMVLGNSDSYVQRSAWRLAGLSSALERTSASQGLLLVGWAACSYSGNVWKQKKGSCGSASADRMQRGSVKGSQLTHSCRAPALPPPQALLKSQCESRRISLHALVSVAEKRATAANRVSGSRPEVLILGLSGPSRVCGTHGLPQGPAAGCRRVLAHRRQPRAVTWRSCALCSRSHPARWCPRSPPCRTSASSSCGALCLRLQSRTRTGRGGRKTWHQSGAARD